METLLICPKNGRPCEKVGNPCSHTKNCKQLEADRLQEEHRRELLQRDPRVREYLRRRGELDD